MEFHEYLRFIFALAFVLALMGIIAQILKRSRFGKMALGIGGGKRLSMIEIRPLDARHKLAIIKCDDREHLVILGPQGSTVVDANVTQPKAAA